jgi:hypothetical protein
MARPSIKLNKDEVRIYGLRIKIDDVPYFLERCKVPEHVLRFLIKIYIEHEKDPDYLSTLWSCVSEHQELSEEFMDEFAPYLSWYYISEHQKLSPEFVLKHIDKITEEIFKNPCYESYPESVKLLLQQKFNRVQLEPSNCSITWSNQNLGVVSLSTARYKWDVFGNGSFVVAVRRKPNIVVRAILRTLLGSKWSPVK